MARSRYGLYALALTIVLLPGACAWSPPSADVMFGGLPRDPQAPLLPGPLLGLDGIYGGIAVAEQYRGTFECPSPMPINNFRVIGNIVFFGGFHGPIAFDGSVTLPFGGMWLLGRFLGATFFGYVDASTSTRQLFGCVYAISVRRLDG